MRWCCNFTWSTSMDKTFFHIFFTNLQKWSEKILFTRQSESKIIFGQNKVSLRSGKGILSVHFSRLVNKIRKNCTFMFVLHVKLQSQQIKTLEMRATSVWQVKFRRFTPIYYYPLNCWPPPEYSCCLCEYQKTKMITLPRHQGLVCEKHNQLKHERHQESIHGEHNYYQK